MKRDNKQCLLVANYISLSDAYNFKIFIYNGMFKNKIIQKNNILTNH